MPQGVILPGPALVRWLSSGVIAMVGEMGMTSASASIGRQGYGLSGISSSAVAQVQGWVQSRGQSSGCVLANGALAREKLLPRLVPRVPIFDLAFC